MNETVTSIAGIVSAYVLFGTVAGTISRAEALQLIALAMALFAGCSMVVGNYDLAAAQASIAALNTSLWWDSIRITPRVNGGA